MRAVSPALDSGHAGYVTDVKARNTTIRSFPDNNRIIVPNSVLASSTLINYSLPEKNLWIDLVVGVSYDSDLEHVEAVAMEAAVMGLPAVATDIRGHRSSVEDGRTGVLVDEGHLGEVIADVLLDDERRRSLGEAALARARPRAATRTISYHPARWWCES